MILNGILASLDKSWQSMNEFLKSTVCLDSLDQSYKVLERF